MQPEFATCDDLAEAPDARQKQSRLRENSVQLHAMKKGSTVLCTARQLHPLLRRRRAAYKKFGGLDSLSTKRHTSALYRLQSSNTIGQEELSGDGPKMKTELASHQIPMIGAVQLAPSRKQGRTSPSRFPSRPSLRWLEFRTTHPSPDR